MRKFLNGSELLFKLEADLRHAYPTFVQEFVSSHCQGVAAVLEALKSIQNSISEVTGLREQRKLVMDELKCLHCVRLCLRNIEAVSKLASYPGGLYPLAAATIGTVSSARIIALEILTTVCTEGGPEGHFKVSEAISTLRLRMGEPIRCKILIGALTSAPPGQFQAKGIKFLTAWVSSAPSPKHKVHIQCELEEAGFSPGGMRKGAELGGAREGRQVQIELEAWDRVSIDVDTLTRQNCQLRNSVATLQQELATLKDQIKRMDTLQKPPEKRRSKPQEIAVTPADSEEEAEQIHQILEDLNNIVNSEMTKKENDIIPVCLVKSPPKPRPWPGSSASDSDSDIIEKNVQNVRKVVKQIELASQRTAPPEPKPDYINFHRSNHMASKFANFKSSKLYASSPDNSLKGGSPTLSSGKFAKVEKTARNESVGLRRSESLHASLASITVEKIDKKSEHMGKDKWKSMEDLDGENFTLKWRYPKATSAVQSFPAGKVSPKSKPNFEICSDYRQNRFTKKVNVLTRYSKKLQSSQQPAQQDLKMFSLPPFLVSQGVDLTNHRICDLPSGLY
jgi:hypothetical protein